MVGAAIGSVVDNTLLAPTITKEGQRLQNLQVQSSDYGAVLPITFGTVRNVGTLIWAEPIDEVRTETSGNEKKGPKTKNITYEYFGNFAVAIADNEIARVNRIWADGKILWDTEADQATIVPQDAIASLSSNPTVMAVDKNRTLTAAGRAKSLTFYLGTEDQLPDPTMVRFKGASHVPAYRGVAYIVFEQLNLKDFGLRVPTITVEYTTIAQDVRVKALAPLPDIGARGSLASAIPHAIPGGGWCAVGLTQTGALRATVAKLNRKARTVSVGAQVDGPTPPANATTLLSCVSPSGRYVASISRVEAAADQGGLMHVSVFDTITQTWMPPLTQPASMLSLYGTDAFWMSDEAFVTSSGDFNAPAKTWHAFYISGSSTVLYSGPASRHLFASNQAQVAGPILQESVFLRSENNAGWVVSSTDYHGAFYYGLRYDSELHALFVQTQPCMNIIAAEGSRRLGASAHVSQAGSLGEWLVAVDSRDKDTEPFAFTMATRNSPGSEGEDTAPPGIALTRGIWSPQTPTGSGFGSIVGMGGNVLVALSFGLDGQKIAYHSLTDSGFTQDVAAIPLPGYQASQATGISPRTYYGASATSDALLVWHEGNLVTGSLLPIIAPSNGLQLAEVVASLLLRAGYDETEFDVSRVQDTLVGYSILNVQPTRNSLEMLQSYSPFDVVSSGPTLRCQSRSTIVTAAISDELVGAGEGTAERSNRLQRARVPDLDLPRSVTVNFIDVGRDFQTGSAFTPRVGGYSENDQVLSLSIPMTAARAKGLAQQTLYRLHGEREKLSGSFPLDYAWLEPADVIIYDGFVVRISKLKLGSGVIEFEGSRVFALTLGAEDEADEGQQPTSEYRLSPLSRLVLLDVPSPRDDDEGLTQFGLHFAVTVDKDEDAWPGAGVVASRDGGDAYKQVGSARLLADVGTLVESLSPHSPAYWDRANSVRLRLPAGSSADFSSGSDDETHEGERLLLVGGEYVAYATATPEPDGTWTFTDLLRGRRGTESEVIEHAAGTRVVAVNQGVRWLQLPLSDRNKPLKVRALTFGTTLGDNDDRDVAVVPKGATLRPYAPVHVAGERDGSSNLVVSWTRSTRAGREWQDEVDAPLSEAAESYQVDILAGPGGAVLRTLTTSAPMVPYSAADQSMDFGSPAPVLSIAAYQLGAVGRGYPAYAVV